MPPLIKVVPVDRDALAQPIDACRRVLSRTGHCRERFVALECTNRSLDNSLYPELTRISGVFEQLTERRGLAACVRISNKINVLLRTPSSPVPLLCANFNSRNEALGPSQNRLPVTRVADKRLGNCRHRNRRVAQHGPRLGDVVVIEGLGPSTLPAARERGFKPGAGAVADDLPLKLGKSASNGIEQSPVWGGGIDRGREPQRQLMRARRW